MFCYLLYIAATNLTRGKISGGGDGGGGGGVGGEGRYQGFRAAAAVELLIGIPGILLEQ